MKRIGIVAVLLTFVCACETKPNPTPEPTPDPTTVPVKPVSCQSGTVYFNGECIPAPSPAPVPEVVEDGSNCTEGKARAAWGKVCCAKACATGYYDSDVMEGCSMLVLLSLHCLKNPVFMKNGQRWRGVSCGCQ